MQAYIGNKYFLFQHDSSGKWGIVIFLIVFLDLSIILLGFFMLTIFLSPHPFFPAIAVDCPLSTDILDWLTNCQV